MHLLRMSKSVTRCFVVESPHSSPESYYDALTRIVNDESVDLVVPVSEEVVYVSALRDRGLPVFSMGQGRTLELHDKARFIRLAQSVGLPVPKTARELNDTLKGGTSRRPACCGYSNRV